MLTLRAPTLRCLRRAALDVGAMLLAFARIFLLRTCRAPLSTTDGWMVRWWCYDTSQFILFLFSIRRATPHLTALPLLLALPTPTTRARLRARRRAAATLLPAALPAHLPPHHTPPFTAHTHTHTRTHAHAHTRCRHLPPPPTPPLHHPLPFHLHTIHPCCIFFFLSTSPRPAGADRAAPHTAYHYHARCTCLPVLPTTPSIPCYLPFW